MKKKNKAGDGVSGRDGRGAAAFNRDSQRRAH